MGESPPRGGLNNAAWVTIPTKLSADQLQQFCRQVERLFRLNPYLTIFSWQVLEDDTVQVDWENHSLQSNSRFATQFQVVCHQNEFQLHYLTGIKQRSFFIIDSNSEGAQLTIIDDYGESDQDKLPQVDKSLNAWGQALGRFFKHYAYLQYIPCIETIIDRWWLRLSPQARRISYILIAITFIELIALILFALLMFIL